MIEDITTPEVEHIGEIIELVSSKEDMSVETRRSIIIKARRYLRALSGDIESAEVIFSGIYDGEGSVSFIGP